MRFRTPRLVLAACVAGCAMVSGSLLLFGAFGDGANAAVKRRLALSTSGSDNGPCSKARPCSTFQRAYDIAKPGQVIEVARGRYPRQRIRGTRTGKRVVFRPARDARVWTDGFEISADDLELRGFKTDYWATHGSANKVILRNIDTGTFIIYGSSNVSVLGGDIGPSYGNGGPTSDSFISYEGGSLAPHNVLIDGTYFHDFKLGYVGDHGQCLQVVGGNGITIRNSRFQRCDGYSIFFTQWAGPAPPSNVLLENNFFDKSTNYGSYTICCSYYAVQFASHMNNYTNITLRNNSTLQEMSFERGPAVRNVNVIANIGPNGGCSNGVVYAYNVWQGRRCSRTDRRARSGFVDPGSLNLHLALGSAAINHGDPQSFPRRDIDGQRRPLGRRVDAGADERR